MDHYTRLIAQKQEFDHRDLSPWFDADCLPVAHWRLLNALDTLVERTDPSRADSTRNYIEDHIDNRAFDALLHTHIEVDLLELRLKSCNVLLCTFCWSRRTCKRCVQALLELVCFNPSLLAISAGICVGWLII